MSEFHRNCHYCLCRVCDGLTCPRPAGHRCHVCVTRDYNSIIDCDYFHFRVVKRFKIKPHKRKKDGIATSRELLEKVFEVVTGEKVVASYCKGCGCTQCSYFIVCGGRCADCVKGSRRVVDCGKRKVLKYNAD